MLVCLFVLFVWSSYVYIIKNTRGILRIVHFDFFPVFTHEHFIWAKHTLVITEKKNEVAHHTERKDKDAQHDQKNTEKQKNMD